MYQTSKQFHFNASYVLEGLDEEFDHRHLNDVMDVQGCDENLAATLYERAKVLCVSEV